MKKRRPFLRDNPFNFFGRRIRYKMLAPCHCYSVHSFQHIHSISDPAAKVQNRPHSRRQVARILPPPPAPGLGGELIGILISPPPAFLNPTFGSGTPPLRLKKVSGGLVEILIISSPLRPPLQAVADFRRFFLGDASAPPAPPPPPKVKTPYLRTQGCMGPKLSCLKCAGPGPQWIFRYIRCYLFEGGMGRSFGCQGQSFARGFVSVCDCIFAKFRLCIPTNPFPPSPLPWCPGGALQDLDAHGTRSS